MGEPTGDMGARDGAAVAVLDDQQPVAMVDDGLGSGMSGVVWYRQISALQARKVMAGP